MAIGRLLSPKLTHHFSSRGFVPLTRKWLSSSLEDGRKFDRLPDPNASANKDAGQKGMHRFSLGGLLTNLKQKITGSMLLFNKSPGEDSVSPKSTVVSSEDAPVTKVVSLQDVAENRNCIPQSLKEESSVSKMGSQDASQSVSGVEIYGNGESASVDKERLDINSFYGSAVAQEKALRLIQAERVDRPEEPSSTDVSLGFLTEEASESMASSEENQGNLQPENEQSDHKKPPQNKLSNLVIKLDPDKDVKLRLRCEALSNSNSIMSTGESCSDAGDPHGLFGKMLFDLVEKVKNTSKENDERKFSALQNPDSLSSILLKGTRHDQKSGDLAANRERKATIPFGSCRGTVVPAAVSKDLRIWKFMESLKAATESGKDAATNSWDPDSGEGKCVSKGNSVTKKCDLYGAREEEESKVENLVMPNQSLCSHPTLPATTANQKLTKKSLAALCIGEHSPNKVMLRFLPEGFEKRIIIEVFSSFGAVLDVQEIPSFEGCIYKDALLTFETKSAVKKALKKGVVSVNQYSAIVEATSPEYMVERIRIPDLIGDPDVPTALVKKPTRTVKVHPLEHKTSSNQIREALSFCSSGISKIIWGSSKTAAFVEFETEDGKERALAEHSISISSKQLFISRIDIPRTTVARILNFSSKNEIRKLCVPYGQIKQVCERTKGVADVHFDVSQWPNMLTILNSLNGKEVKGVKLVVRPATTVIPHEILKVLWEDPREKRYVKGLIQSMVKELQQPLDTTSIAAIHTDLLLKILENEIL